MEPARPSFADWVAAHRRALSRGGLWLAGNEPGRPDPAGFEKARLRILICRLSPYDDVLASITHRLLLATASSVPGVYADLAFFPPEKDAALMRKAGVPLWLATGCKRAPADFDVVAVSLSVQQEAANLPAALLGSGLRLDHAGRMEDARHPLVILGGHGAPSVPFIHGDAAGPGSGGLVDAVCLGDGVAWLRDFLRRLAAHRKAGGSRRDFLLALARELPGTYVPAFYRHVHRAGRLAAIEPAESGLPLPVPFRQDPMEEWLQNYDGAFIPLSAEELEETLPLAAGCLYRCRFCQTGWMRREFSAAARKDLVAAALRFKAAMVNSDLNLLASDACSIAGLDPIMDALCPLFRHVSVKSLSVSSLVRRPEYFQLLRRLAKHEFTFGVEGVSARLRAWLGKPATAPDLLRIAASLAGGGLRQLKLFFIVTGLEEDRDFAELENLLRGIRAKIPAARVIASFMPLFHAPFTPLQYAPVRPVSRQTEQALSALVRHAGAEFRWSAYLDEIALMNRLCRAGRAATPALVEFSLQRGLRYDKSLAPGLIQELARALPGDPGEIDAGSVLPWSDLRASADPATLWRSYRKACEEWQAAPESASLPAAPLRASAPAPEPPPPAAERRAFWLHVPAEQARHPDHVVVRAALRSLFAAWRKGAAAYEGDPRLLHPPGTSGIALASAAFRTDAPWPKKFRSPAPADLSGIAEDKLVFGIRWMSAKSAEMALQKLREGRVKHQTFRRGDRRWHVVERAFRARTGLWAVCEGPDRSWLYVEAKPALVESWLSDPSQPPGEVVAVFARSDSACPRCRGAAFRILRAAGDETLPACLDCLAQPDRA